MSKSKLIDGGIFFIVCAVLLSACFSQTRNIPEQATGPARTEALLPATELASPSPEPTLLPTETPVPSPTPIPWPSQPITEENAQELKEINRWGRGSPLEIRKLQRNNEESLVLTSLGVHLYQTTPPYELAFIPDANEFWLSQDEHLLAVGLKNGDVQIWNMDDMSLQQTFVHSFPEEIVKKIEDEHLLPFYVGGIAFSPDNSEIAVGYADGAVALYRLGEMDPYLTLRHDAFSLWQTDIGLVFQLSYSPGGKTLVVFKYEPYINANRLTFWSLPDGELISVSEAGRFYEFAEPAYLPDNQTLLVFSRHDSYLYLTTRDIQTGAQLSRFDTDLVEIISTELAADGSQIIIYGWDAQRTYYRQVRSLPEGNWIENEKLDEHSDHEYLTRITKFLFEQGHYYYSWDDGENPKFAQLGVSDNQTFRVLGEDYWLMFPEGNSEPLSLPEEASNPYYDPHEQTLGWCTKGALHFMDKDSQMTTVELPPITNCDGIVVSPQRHYAVVWYNVSRYLINLETGKFNKLSFSRGWESETLAVRFSFDEKILITSTLGLITVWQVDPPQVLTKGDPGINTGHNVEVVFPKGDSFFVTLNDASDQSKSDSASDLRVWRIEDAFAGRVIHLPLIGASRPDFTAFALSPNAELLASGDDFGGIRIWSVKSGDELAYFDIDALPLDLAFTPDGSGLIILLGDGTVRLWGVP